MSKDNFRFINLKVSNEMWKKLKIISIQKDMALSDFLYEFIEKSFSSKKYENVLTIDNISE